ncbi:hypothetical protein [Georgenia subflava]|uniref:hypothetical protein n=1 Tax=Georgenia subflava TaxID=1622177 RepID=UPI00186B0CAD|nr:hypothetical protein [Georgenia subflava]
MQEREKHWEERLATPVLVAALASVPAVFLTLLDEPYRSVGTVATWASGAVLVAEAVVLFAVSADKLEWLTRRAWLLGLTGLVIVGALLALGPVQLLRLLRVVGALRIVRVGRIVKAARILRERLGLTGRWTRVATVSAGVLVAVFVAVVLADPTSQTRTLIDEVAGRGGGVALVVVAGALMAVATFVVMRQRLSSRGRGETATTDGPRTSISSTENAD